MVAAAMTGGDVLIQDAIWEHNRPLLAKLQEMGVEVIDEDEGIRIRSQRDKLKAVHVKTLPHPGFLRTCEAQFTALMTVAQGESTMIETVFENRFQHLEEMRRMGLHSEIIRDTARYRRRSASPRGRSAVYGPSCQCSFDPDRFSS